MTPKVTEHMKRIGGGLVGLLTLPLIPVVWVAIALVWIGLEVKDAIHD